jgi:hypothetical protein
VPITGTSASTQTVQRSNEPYRVSAEEYVRFHKQETLLVRGLVPREDVQEVIDHMDNLLAGRETIPGIAVPSFRQSPQEKLQYCNARSWVPWNHGTPYEGESANYLHILARGTTHLPMRSRTSAHLVQRTSPKRQYHIQGGASRCR